MVRTRIFIAILTATTLFSFQPSTLFARIQPSNANTAVPLSKAAADPPFVTYATHNLGKVALTVTNNGTFGRGFITVDPGTPSCEYPVNSNLEYLFGAAFWIGAIVGRDTLVSLGTDGWSNPSIKELWPASEDAQNDNNESMVIRSISDPSSPDFFNAKSERDIVVVYYDTLVGGEVIPDPFDGRPHRPLNIRVKETSYSWSYSYAEDFVLFDYQITNNGDRTLEKVYMGIYVDGDAGFQDDILAASDDICGFKRTVPGLDLSGTGCLFEDTINIAWIADNNGVNDPNDIEIGQAWEREYPQAVAGTRVVRTPNEDSLGISFNWWVSNTNAALDFGPRLRSSTSDPFRDFGGFIGTPEGDKNKYYMMYHKEFDYDQLFSAKNLTDKGWLPPATQSTDIANGFDTRYLLSFGPFTIFPGETLPLTFAQVCGENFHRGGARKMSDIFDPTNPEAYDSIYLDYKDLGVNAQWASWIYDNPGVDTDLDGFKGKYRVCYGTVDSIWYDTYYNQIDTTYIDSIVPDTLFADSTLVFYQGDGIPDFRGATPPPAPEVRVLPAPNTLTVQWNGLRSETTPDDFSNKLDFEGYRVYTGLTKLASDLSLATSYDRENFQKYVFDPSLGEHGAWKLDFNPPMSLQNIQILYASGNTDYDPLVNTIDNPLRNGDSLFYFVPQDFNRDDLTDPNGITRIYPDAPYPHTIFRDSAFAYGVDTFFVDPLSGDTIVYPMGELTPDGRNFQRFEYQYILRRINGSLLTYVSVTAFDFGAPVSGLAALESNPLLNIVAEYPQFSADLADSLNLGVTVYPNPYRSDGNYRSVGYEGLGKGNFTDDAVREVHFINLPAQCLIRIFTLDGDLVREIAHNAAPNAPQSAHESWDLITRNRQLAVSGLYYWVVEPERGPTQLGKLVLVM